MKTFKVLALSATAVLFASSAMAERGEFKQQIMQHLDTDGDGQISLAEFQPPRHEGHLEEADANGDGSVTLEELQAQMAQRMAERQAEHAERKAEHMSRLKEHFAEMDTNGDGGITMEEARGAVFSKMDTNGDGFLSADELKRPRGMRGGPGERGEGPWSRKGPTDD